MIVLGTFLLAAAAAAAPAPVLTARAESGEKSADSCSYEFSYAQLKGPGDPKVLAKLNAKLKELGTLPDACENADDSLGGDDPKDPAPAGPPEEHQASSGAGVVLGGHYLLAEFSSWEFAGGAHGNGGSGCAVLDLRTGETVSLAARLKPDASALIRKRVVAEVYGGDQGAADGYLIAGKPSAADANICPNGKGLTLHFNPYEVASYADGAKDLEIGAADWSAYFAADEATRAVFAGGSVPVPQEKPAAAK